MHSALASHLCPIDNMTAYNSCMSTFGERLQAARIKAGFATRAEAQKAFGFSSAIYQHERREDPPRKDTIERYATDYRVSVAWLQSGVGDGPEVQSFRAPRNPAAAIPDEWAEASLNEQVGLVLSHFTALALEHAQHEGGFDPSAAPSTPAAMHPFWKWAGGVFADTLAFSMAEDAPAHVGAYLKGAQQKMKTG